MIKLIILFGVLYLLERCLKMANFLIDGYFETRDLKKRLVKNRVIKNR